MNDDHSLLSKLSSGTQVHDADLLFPLWDSRSTIQPLTDHVHLQTTRHNKKSKHRIAHRLPQNAKPPNRKVYDAVTSVPKPNNTARQKRVDTGSIRTRIKRNSTKPCYLSEESPRKHRKKSILTTTSMQ